jgi:hypothetical protein
MSLDKALRKAVAGTMVAVASLLPLALAQAAPALTEFVKPGAATTTLWDVNNLGHMVGSSTSGTAPTDFPIGFVYDGATFTTIMPAGAVSSSALGISDGGVVVGSYYSSYTDDGAGNVVPGPSWGFMYSAGAYTTFIVAGAENTYLRGISPNGRYLSGYYSTATAVGIGFVYDTVAGTLAIVSKPASLLTIPQGINAAGVVAGSDILGGPPTTRPAFTYDIATGTRTDYVLAGATRTAFRSIDDAGTLAGWFIDAGGATHGFVGTVASFEQVDFPGADSTFVEGSNNAGVLVGNYFVGTTSHAFVTSLPGLLLQELAGAVVGVGPGRSLAGKVSQAQSYYAAGNVGAACTMLSDFINEVRAQRGKKIAAATADALIADARAIMAAMGCS